MRLGVEAQEKPFNQLGSICRAEAESFFHDVLAANFHEVRLLAGNIVGNSSFWQSLVAVFSLGKQNQGLRTGPGF
jgi:hypothetical protein